MSVGKIGEVMLNNDTSSRRKDITSIGSLLDSLRPGGNNQTENQRWSDKARKFLENTKTVESAQDLIKV